MEDSTDKKGDYSRLSMDEIVFEGRNKDYGAYFIRKGYRRTLTRALLISVLIFVVSLLMPGILKKLGLFDSKPEDYEKLISRVYENIPMPAQGTKMLKPPAAVKTDKIVVKEDVKPLPDPDKTSTAKNDKQKPDTTGQSGGTPNGNKGGHGDTLYAAGSTQKQAHYPASDSKEADMMFREYVMEHTIAPPEVEVLGINGYVEMSFIVETDGKITNVKAEKVVTLDRKKPLPTQSCKDAAIRMIQNMPDWVPAEQRGKKVRMIFKVPITFKSF